MLIREKVTGFTNLYKSAAGLWDRKRDIFVPLVPRGWNVRGLLLLPTGEREALLGHNLISDAGELWYAQKIAGDATTNAFAAHELATTTPGAPAGTDDRSDYTIQSGSEASFASGYPKRNDTDTDNTGKGAAVYTFKVAYSAAAGNWTGLNGGIITNATPGASEPILTGYSFGGAVNKDSSTALTIWINHAPTGV